MSLESMQDPIIKTPTPVTTATPPPAPAEPAPGQGQDPAALLGGNTAGPVVPANLAPKATPQPSLAKQQQIRSAAEAAAAPNAQTQVKSHLSGILHAIGDALGGPKTVETGGVAFDKQGNPVPETRTRGTGERVMGVIGRALTGAAAGAGAAQGPGGLGKAAAAGARVGTEMNEADQKRRMANFEMFRTHAGMISAYRHEGMEETSALQSIADHALPTRDAMLNMGTIKSVFGEVPVDSATMQEELNKGIKAGYGAAKQFASPGPPIPDPTRPGKMQQSWFILRATSPDMDLASQTVTVNSEDLRQQLSKQLGVEVKMGAEVPAITLYNLNGQALNAISSMETAQKELKDAGIENKTPFTVKDFYNLKGSELFVAQRALNQWSTKYKGSTGDVVTDLQKMDKDNPWGATWIAKNLYQSKQKELADFREEKKAAERSELEEKQKLQVGALTEDGANNILATNAAEIKAGIKTHTFTTQRVDAAEDFIKKKHDPLVKIESDDNAFTGDKAAGTLAMLGELRQTETDPARLVRINHGIAAAKAGHSAWMNDKYTQAKFEQDIKVGDPKSAAEFLANRTMTIADFKNRGMTTDWITQALHATQQYCKDHGLPPYDAVAEDVAERQSQGVQNVQFFTNANSLVSEHGTLAQLRTASEGLAGQTQLPMLNKWEDIVQMATGGGAPAKVAALAIGAADDLSQVMGGGGTDTARAQVLKVVDAKLSPEQRKQAFDGIINMVNSKRVARFGRNMYLRRLYGLNEQETGGFGEMDGQHPRFQQGEQQNILDKVKQAAPGLVISQ